MPHGIHRSFGRALTLIALAFAGLAGCAEDPAQNRPGPATEEPREPLSEAQIVGVVSTIDQGEIAQAEIAQMRARDMSVREYARRLRAEHQATEGRLQALQAELGMRMAESELGADLRQQNERIAEQLRQTSNAQFDVVFLDGQIGLHQRAILILDTQLLPQSENARVETFLQDTRASLVTHLVQARRLRARFPQEPGGGLNAR